MMNNCHILIIVENLPVPFDPRVWREAKTLKQAGYDVSVICPKGYIYQESYEEREGIHIYRHPVPREAESVVGYVREFLIAFIWELFLSIKVFLGKPFKIIQGCNPPDNIFLIALIYRVLGVKYIFDHHDLAPEGYVAKFARKDFIYGILLFLEKLTYKAAHVAMVTNETYKETAINRGHMKPERVFVVRNGPEMDKFKAACPQKDLKHGKQYLVGYVGNMGKQEGIDILLSVIRHIVQERKRMDVHLTIVGGGSALSHLIEQSEKMDLNRFVNFTGRISDQELLEILSTSDVCVNPDTPNELNDKSTMIKIMEYMSFGKPIVQFDLREGKYSAQESSLYAKKGSVEDFAEKILWLLDHPKERARMGNFGRNRVEQALAWKYSIPNLLKAYEVSLHRQV